jgi:hypothetical protein
MTIELFARQRRHIRRKVAIAMLVTVFAATLAAPVIDTISQRWRRPTPQPSPVLLAPSGPSATAASTATLDALLPTDLDWLRLAGVDLPISSSAGPRQRSTTGVASGFAYSRPGAVLAALHLLVQTSPQVGPAVFTPTLANQVTGPYAAAMRVWVAQTYHQDAAASGVADGQPLGELPARFAGVRLDEFTQTHAALAVLTAAVDVTGVTRYATTTVRLRWTGQDWALLAPAQGRWDNDVYPATDLGDYTPLVCG